MKKLISASLALIGAIALASCLDLEKEIEDMAAPELKSITLTEAGGDSATFECTTGQGTESYASVVVFPVGEPTELTESSEAVKGNGIYSFTVKGLTPNTDYTAVFTYNREYYDRTGKGIAINFSTANQERFRFTELTGAAYNSRTFYVRSLIRLTENTVSGKPETYTNVAFNKDGTLWNKNQNIWIIPGVTKGAAAAWGVSVWDMPVSDLVPSESEFFKAYVKLIPWDHEIVCGGNDGTIPFGITMKSTMACLKILCEVGKDGDA